MPDAQRPVAWYQGRVPDAHTGDVGDRVALDLLLSRARLASAAGQPPSRVMMSAITSPAISM